MSSREIGLLSCAPCNHKDIDVEHQLALRLSVCLAGAIGLHLSCARCLQGLEPKAKVLGR